MSAAVVLLINILTGVISVRHSETTSQGTATAQLDVYGDSGIFLSPGYPNVHSINLNLTYTAHLDSSGPLVVRLYMVIDLEKLGDRCYDYVKIGSTSYCGNKTERTEVEVSGNLLTMLFITDSTRNFPGFNITYTVIQETTETQASTSMETDEKASSLLGSMATSSDSSSAATDQNVASSTDSPTDSSDSSIISSTTDPRTESMATDQNVGSSTHGKETFSDSLSMATVQTVGSSADNMTTFSDSSTTSSITARTENQTFSNVSIRTNHEENIKARSGDSLVFMSKLTPVTTESGGNYSIPDITTPVISSQDEKDKKSNDISDARDPGFTSSSKGNTNEQNSKVEMSTFDTLSTSAGDRKNESVTPRVISTDLMSPPEAADEMTPPVNCPPGEKDEQSSDISLISNITDATSQTFRATSDFSDTKMSRSPQDESLSTPVVSYDSRPPQLATTPPSKAPPVLAPCRCKSQQSGDNETAEMTSQRAAAQAQQLARALAVDKGNVSSQKRRKISAPNGRPTATTCGVMVMAVCVAPFLLLVVADLAAICMHAASPGNRRNATA